MARKGRPKLQKSTNEAAEETQTPAKRTASSHLAHNTATPYSSDGPTLPTIRELRDSQKAARMHEGAHKQQGRGGTKRKSNKNTPESLQRRQPERLPPKKRHRTQLQKNSMKAGKEVSIDTKALPPLPSPWLLLPTSILETLSARFPSQASFEDSCIPLHITRNSNITSAVNRLKVYLGWCGKEREPTIQWPQALESDNRIIAVSAQGEGTSKLASIMEVAKRVVSEGDGEAVVWYSYTGLGSQAIIVDSAGKNENADNVMDDEEDLFETLNQAEEQEQEREPKQSPKIRKVPVLTVWMSKSQIPEFRGPFGEQMFKVGQMQEEG